MGQFFQSNNSPVNQGSPHVTKQMQSPLVTQQSPHGFSPQPQHFTFPQQNIPQINQSHGQQVNYHHQQPIQAPVYNATTPQPQSANVLAQYGIQQQQQVINPYNQHQTYQNPQIAQQFHQQQFQGQYLRPQQQLQQYPSQMMNSKNNNNQM